MWRSYVVVALLTGARSEPAVAELILSKPGLPLTEILLAFAAPKPHTVKSSNPAPIRFPVAVFFDMFFLP
jgi:hypothetical protein